MVVLLQALSELVVARNHGVALVLITPLALLAAQLAAAEPVAEVVQDRLLETVLGVVVGLVCAGASARAHRARRST